MESISVYLGYVWLKHDARELVGVFSTKRAAYISIRKKIKEVLIEQIDLWQGYSPAYIPNKVYWFIDEHVVL